MNRINMAKEDGSENTNKLVIDVIITEEKVNDKKMFVAQAIQLDIASHDVNPEKAIEKLKEAVSLYLEDSPQLKIELAKKEKTEQGPMLTRFFL